MNRRRALLALSFGAAGVGAAACGTDPATRAACERVETAYATTCSGVTPTDDIGGARDVRPGPSGSDAAPDEPVDDGAPNDGALRPDAPVLDAGPESHTCAPLCLDRVCGDDGCGGSCGACSDGTRCRDGACAGPPDGGLSCAELIECVQPCDSEGCWSRCTEQGTREARRLFESVYDCLVDNCSGASTEEEAAICQTSTCGGPFRECYDVTGPINIGCEEMLSCISECRDDTCLTGCYLRGTADAQRSVSGFFDCASSRCEGPSYREFVACGLASCGGAERVCAGGGPGPDP